eukprot:13380746-Ditylum_brightwellii.AAC.1
MEQRNKNIANVNVTKSTTTVCVDGESISQINSINTNLHGGGSRMGTSATEDLSEASSLTYRSTTSSFIPNALCLKQFLGVDETAWEHSYDNDENQGPFFNTTEMGGPDIQ